MPAHILLAALLATPTVVPPPKEPAVYATIKFEKKACAWAMAFSPDGKTLAYIHHRGQELGENLVFWDVAKKEVVTTLTADGEKYRFFGDV
jgi:hypothetical protein